MEARQKLVGETKDVGFEIGVRKMFDVSPAEAWRVITSEEGVRVWLGDVPGLRWEVGSEYQTANGATGKIRVLEPGSHFRMTWQPPEWEKASLIQVRVIPSGAKTVISFHQEHLLGPREREQMGDRWQAALDALEQLLNDAAK